MRGWYLVVLVSVASCAAQEKSDVAETAAAQPVPVAVTATLDEFKQIHSWLQGVWRGSGGAYPSFFEEYRVLDDSTIRMRSFSDSTRQVVSDSSMIEWRNRMVRSRSARSTYDVIAISPDSIRFIKPGATSGGHTFRKVSPDEWTARLHPAQAQGQPTVYVMRRIGQ
jgi:hypothetical protein